MSFFVPGYRYADKGEGGKNHEKRTLWENAAFIRGSVYAYDGCGTKESSKMDTKDMTTRDAEFHTQNYLAKIPIFFAGG